MGAKKTTEQHAAEVKALGVLVLKGDYKGARIKTIYYCPKHDFTGEALPTNVLKGRGLMCCKNPTTDPSTGMKTTAMHAEEVRKLGRVQLVSKYVEAKTKCTYRCLLHNEEHEALPTNVLKGIGLTCCQRTLGAATNIRRHGELYDGRLKEIGKLHRLGGYIDSKTPILHRCLVHGGEGMQSPNAAVQGTGLKCCLDAARQNSADQKRQSVIDRLRNELGTINPNLEWVGGEYKDQNSLLQMRCKTHDEIHLASWQQITQGCGVYCCRMENLRNIGKRSLNRFDVDSVWRVLTGSNERAGNAWLYLYESPVRPFNKYGISNDVGKRANSGEYGTQLIEPRFFAKRDDAVLIEQAFRYGYGVAIPEALAEWTGNTELTTLEPDEFVEVIEELEGSLIEMGRWVFAEEFCDPREIERARKEST